MSLTERFSKLGGAPAPLATPEIAKPRLADRFTALSGPRDPLAVDTGSAPRLTERLAGLLTGPGNTVAVEKAPTSRLSQHLAGLSGTAAVVAQPDPPRETLFERFSKDYQLLSQTSPESIMVPFGPWMPDLPDLANPGATVALNVIPQANSYGPLGALEAATVALDARVLGAVIARDTAGNNYNYAGDAAKLYQVGASGVTDKSKGGGYSTVASEGWEFVSFAGDLIATNYADAVQSITAGAAGLFADLITSTLKPKARHAEVVREFLVLGNTSDGTDGVVPHRIWWSARNDPADFDPDSLTQCDFENRPQGGYVQRIIGGAEYGLVFQERSITRMSYAGEPHIFQFDEIDRKRGTPVPNSVIGHGRLVYYISEEGFFVCDGTQSIPIGANQVDKTFWAQFDTNNAHLVSAAIDPINKLVAWAFNRKIWFYDWQNRRWSEADIDADMLINGTSEAYTLEELDAVALDTDADTTLDATEAAAQTTISVASTTNFAVADTVRITLDNATIHQSTIASISAGVSITIDDGLPSQATSGNRFVRTSIDVLTPGLDSPVWGGGGLAFGAYDTKHKLAYFTGPNLAATIETGEIELHPSRQSKVTKLRPLIDGGTLIGAVAGRDRLVDAVNFDAAHSLDDTGEIDALNESRYHRIRCKIAALGSWTHAQGVQVIASPMGTRG
ncbi:MAG: hypothetical protein ACTSU0_11845 [Alphaproteobacteria bacterium]